MRILSNYDIGDLCRKHNIMLNGLLYKNNIPKTLKNGWYIYLMAKSNDNVGHYVAFYYNNNNNYYFDSYGQVPCLEVDKLLNHKYVYNRKKIQSLNSSSCGWFCLMIINECNRHNNTISSWNNVINQFSDKEQINENILESYWKNI